MSRPTESEATPPAKPAGRGARISAFAVALALLCSAGLALLLGIRDYPQFFVDDAFISLRYADRLLDGKGLTYTDGERVEGYSNFLWVIAISALGAPRTAPLVDIARTLATTVTLAGFAFFWVAAPLRRWSDALPAGVATLSLAVCGPVAAWAVGGLEQPLLAACIVLAFAAAARAAISKRPGRWFALAGSLSLAALLTRPDGALFSGTLWLGALSHHMLSAKGAAPKRLAAGLRATKWLVLLPAIGGLLHLAFRRSYYGAWVPNTFHAKVALGQSRYELGKLYLESLQPLWPLGACAIPILAALVLSRHFRRASLGPLLALLLWVAYVVAIGGDIMPQRRHWVVALFLWCFVTTGALRALSERRLGLIASLLFLVSLPPALHFTQRQDAERLRAQNDLWHWPGRPVGHMLNRLFARQDPLLAVDAAGALPFYSRLRVLDMLGLNDARLARMPPAGFGSGPLGHELGNGAYFLERKPDLIVFHYPVGLERALWRGGREMQADRSFGRLYALVRMRTPAPDEHLLTTWIRRDGAVGIQRTPERMTIPGYLLIDAPDTVSTLDSEGWAGPELGPGQVARGFFEIPKGRHRITAEGRGELFITASLRGPDAAQRRGVGSVVVDLPHDPSGIVLDVALAWGDKGRIRQVLVERLR